MRPGAFAPELVPWEPWTPAEVAQRLAGVEAPWCVAAGWALDLFLGGVPREHEDLELAVPADRAQEVFAALEPLEPHVPYGPGRCLPLAEAVGAESHQTFMLDRSRPCWRLDVFREPTEAGVWVCRRDERISLPYGDVIARTESGIPYLRPELVLLFKAKHARPKDDGDFAEALPVLAPAPRAWLREALAEVHPGHRWLGEL